MCAFSVRSPWSHPELGCITCSHVASDERPVEYVWNAGDSWCLLCGDVRHIENDDDDTLTAVHIAEILAREPLLSRFSHLPIHRAALRDERGEWQIEVDVADGYDAQPDDIVGLTPDEIIVLHAQAMRDGLWLLQRADGASANVNFDTGLSAVPIWRNRAHAEMAIAEHWPGDSPRAFELMELDKLFRTNSPSSLWLTLDFPTTEVFYVCSLRELHKYGER